MEKHEIQKLVNELLKKEKTERKRKFRFMIFTFLGIAYSLFWAWTENPDSGASIWTVELAGWAILIVPGSFLAAFLNSKSSESPPRGSGFF